LFGEEAGEEAQTPHPHPQYYIRDSLILANKELGDPERRSWSWRQGWSGPGMGMGAWSRQTTESDTTHHILMIAAATSYSGQHRASAHSPPEEAQRLSRQEQRG